METFEAIRSRRNVRAFTDQPLAAGDLLRILEAGRLAPSASNRQRREFVLVTQRPTLVRLSTSWQGAGHVATSAATVVLCAPEPANEREAAINQYDLGQATILLALAAADLGIGSGHASVGDQSVVAEALAIPDDWSAYYYLALGYPADRPLRVIHKPDRRPFAEIVHRERW